MGGSVSNNVPESCAHLRSIIADVVSGEASTQAAKEVDAHMLDCLDCRAEFELARAIEGKLVGFPDLEPPASIWTKLEARLDAEQEPVADKKATVKQPALRLVRLPARS